MSRVLAIAVLLSLALPSEGWSQEAEALERIDRIVAVVGERLVTASDVELEAILTARDPRSVAVLSAGARTPLESLIDAAIIRGLAGNIAVYQPDDADVRARLDALRATFEDPDAWRRFLLAFGLDEDALAGILYSRMVVERVVHRNVGLASEAARETPDAYLKRYEAWIAERRNRVSVRLVAERGAP